MLPLFLMQREPSETRCTNTGSQSPELFLIFPQLRKLKKMMNEKSRSWLPFGRSHIFYGWWIVLACFIIGLYTGGIIFYGFTAFIDPLVREFGWSYTQVSFAMSLRGIEMSFISPLVGFLVDRYGPRRLVFLGVVTIGLGFFMMGVSYSLWVVYAR